VKSAIGCPTAAKTGTTTELVDAWLDGFNSEYSTVVWMGYPSRRVPMTSVHGEAQQGGRLPADIWHAYMSAVTQGKPCAPLNESSSGISYQPFFGKYATTGQSKSVEEGGGGRPAAKPEVHKAPPRPARPHPAAPPPSAGKTGGAEPH
jgi:membrane peptidoglycan carboxypeptidase